MRNLLIALASWGPWGVFLLAVLDSGGVPIVGGVDALVVTIAALDHSQAYWAATAAITGSVIGSLVRSSQVDRTKVSKPVSQPHTGSPSVSA